MTSSPGYPARLRGHLDVPLSRWLWLVKWVLVVPHAVVLVFLWLALVVLTVVAGVSVLVTGVYPRRIFDFAVGVMRWTWRAAFYTTAAFATDTYPPFTLRSDPGYPADLDVDYPERLSRGLVLVKWWLLALPHYLVIAMFTGGWSITFRDGGWQVPGPGLVVLLTVIAMVMTLFGRRYPQPLFDFVMGLDRWCFRVLTYALLLRDEYPPFRLDAGSGEPGSMPGSRTTGGHAAG